MSSKYKKDVRSLWSEDNMKRAIKLVLDEGQSEKRAAKNCGIPRQTLRRYLYKARSGDQFSLKEKLGRRSVLTTEQERELVNVLLDMEKRLFGVSVKDVKKYVFQYCEKNGIVNPFNAEKCQAGKDWFQDFLKRNPEISIRKPEATSMQRAIGFNKTKVQIFFRNLKKLVFYDNEAMRIPPENMFNVDESGYTSVHKPGKIVARKGKKCVGALTSAEKGKTITVVCCVSAVGQYIPPMFIFPRVRMRPDLLDRGPSGAIGVANPSGWINEELFETWFDHFLKIVRPEVRPEPVLIILDGHTSHTKNLSVIMKARQNNVVLLSLPSHCTHRLQPLDVAVFKSINAFYDQAVSTWLAQHPGRVVTEKEIPELFMNAYGKGGTIKNAASGFKKCGIFPFDPEVFKEEDFIASDINDFVLISDEGTNHQTAETTELESFSIEHIRDYIPKTPEKAGNCSQPTEKLKNNNIMIADNNNLDKGILASTSTDENIAPKITSPSFRDLIPVPVRKTVTMNTRKRKVAHSSVLTESPYKNELMESATKKVKSIPKRKVFGKKNNTDEEDADCIFCNESFSATGGTWIRCMNCQKWAHVECAGVSKTCKMYYCDLCQ